VPLPCQIQVLTSKGNEIERKKVHNIVGEIPQRGHGKKEQMDADGEIMVAPCNSATHVAVYHNAR
jgi:hypothetical protein